MNYKSLILLLIVNSSLLIANCQNDSTVKLSLDSCLSMALRSSFDVQIAEQLNIKAKAEREAARSMYFPKIAANGGYTYVFNNIELLKNIDGLLPKFDISSADIPQELKIQLEKGLAQLRAKIMSLWNPIEISLKGAYFAGITLQQPVFAGGRIIAGNKMAAAGIELSEENIKLKKSELIVEAQKMYWLYVSVREKVKLAKSYGALLAELEKMLANVVDVEMINRNELMKVQVQHNAVKLQIMQAQTGMELARMALCRMIGVDYETQIIPVDTIVQVTEIEILPPENAVYSRPEYKLMQKQIAMKDGEVKLVTGNYLPTVGLTATYGIMGGMKIMDKLEEPYNISNVAAVVSIPILDWWEGSQKIRSAKTDKKIAELEMQKNSQLMELEIKQATFNAINAFQQIKNAEFALEQSQENLRISTDRYMVNLETITDLMMAQSTWQTAYSNLIDARIDYRLKEIEFLKAIGKLSIK
ncbi:MAG: TolC family protein [Prevotellaceae bacterium]|jgi:outer membrane protein TolC|nr:TolC family protein [Prevotellaceae bacterium]